LSNLPPSLNESGVTFSIPTTNGRVIGTLRPRTRQCNSAGDREGEVETWSCNDLMLLESDW